MMCHEAIDVAGAIHPTANVFLCRPSEIDDPALLARYEALLDCAERARLARFHFRRDAHNFLIAHALVRTALSEFEDVEPSRWRFRMNEFGRPEVVGPVGFGGLRFNLSHCDGLIACVVTSGQECGVDVEDIRVSSDLLDVAGDYFSEPEIASLQACPRDTTPDLFYSFWTLKESYIKARGAGLGLPLDKFSFSLSNGRIDARFDPDIEVQPHDWSFTLMRPDQNQVLAVALRKPSRQPYPRLALHWWVPLRGSQSSSVSGCQVASSSLC